jgi:hypothetical protein
MRRFWGVGAFISSLTAQMTQAAGYLPKTGNTDEVVTAIDTVLKGETYLPERYKIKLNFSSNPCEFYFFILIYNIQFMMICCYKTFLSQKIININHLLCDLSIPSFITWCLNSRMSSISLPRPFFLWRAYPLPVFL